MKRIFFKFFYIDGILTPISIIRLSNINEQGQEVSAIKLAYFFGIRVASWSAK